MTSALPASNSATNPIEVSIVPRAAHGCPGVLSLSITPGKKDAHGVRAVHDRDLEADLRRLRRQHGIDVLVTLLERHEFATLRVQALPDRARSLGMELLAHPVRDLWVPALGKPFDALVDSIIARLERGLSVAITCRGGLGRSGTIACCVLVRLGVPAATALAVVRRARPGAVETALQERFVVAYGDRHGCAARATRGGGPRRVRPARTGRR